VNTDINQWPGENHTHAVFSCFMGTFHRHDDFHTETFLSPYHKPTHHKKRSKTLTVA